MNIGELRKAIRILPHDMDIKDLKLFDNLPECPLEDWMVVWVSGRDLGADWDCVPDHIRSAVRMIADIDDLIAQAIQEAIWRSK